MKVSYPKDKAKHWSEEQEVAIAELLDLTEEQGDKLFAKKGTIVVADTYKQKWERFLSDADVIKATSETPPIKDVSVAGSHAKLARDLADQIKDNEQVNARARLTIVSGEEVKRGPLALCLLLEKNYGSNSIAAFPDHDAYGWERKVKHDDGTEETIAASANPAKWKVPGKSAKGNAIEVPYDFYQVYADRTAFGEEIIAASEACSKAQEVYSAKGSTKTCENYTTASGDVIPLQGITGPDLKAEADMWSKRRSALAGQYRSAIRLHKKLAAMQTEYPGVIVQVSKTPDGSLGRGQYPITVTNKENMGEFKRFTPSNFLNLDMDAATNNGGTYENLLATVGKGTSDDDNDTPKVVEAIKSAATADEYIAELVAYLEKKKPSGEFALMVYLNAKDNDGKHTHDDLLLSCRTLQGYMDSIVTKCEKRFAELDEAGEEKTGTNN